MCYSENKPEYWFWALEWNKHLRIIGGIYAPGEQPPIFSGLPAQGWVQVGKGDDGSVYRIKKEIPLLEDDLLFAFEVFRKK